MPRSLKLTSSTCVVATEQGRAEVVVVEQESPLAWLARHYGRKRAAARGRKCGRGWRRGSSSGWSDAFPPDALQRGAAGQWCSR